MEEGKLSGRAACNKISRTTQHPDHFINAHNELCSRKVSIKDDEDHRVILKQGKRSDYTFVNGDILLCLTQVWSSECENKH